MDKFITYASGGVFGGVLLYVSLIFFILFIWAFMMKFSPVVNRRKFSTITFVLIGLLILTFGAQRLARPPIPAKQYVAILPLPLDVSSLYPASGWALAETSTSILEHSVGSHIHILRPEWQIGAFQSDSHAFATFRDPDARSKWIALLGLSVVAVPDIEWTASGASVTITMLQNGNPISSFNRELSNSSEPDFRRMLISLGNEVANAVAQALDEPLNSEKVTSISYDTPSLWDYSAGRLELLGRRFDAAAERFSKAISRDSSSVIAYYGLGLSHGERMLRAASDPEYQNHQIRAEINLKRANQLQEDFQPALSALAYYYMFFKPEPRYLDSEIALIAGNMIYDRDYLTYDVLSYMQPIRWETFDLSSRDEVLHKAIELNPAAFDAYVRLARSYLQLSKPHDYRAKTALALFTTANQLRPDDLTAVIGLVQAADYMAQYDRALGMLQRMQEMYPDKADVYYNMGVVTYHLGLSMRPKKKKAEEIAYFRKAEAHFLKCVDLKRDYGYAFLYLAKIYKATEQREPAIDALRTAMRVLKPEDPYREEARKTLRDYFPDVED